MAGFLPERLTIIPLAAYLKGNLSSYSGNDMEAFRMRQHLGLVRNLYLAWLSMGIQLVLAQAPAEIVVPFVTAQKDQALNAFVSQLDSLLQTTCPRDQQTTCQQASYQTILPTLDSLGRYDLSQWYRLRLMDMAATRRDSQEIVRLAYTLGKQAAWQQDTLKAISQLTQALQIELHQPRPFESWPGIYAFDTSQTDLALLKIILDQAEDLTDTFLATFIHLKAAARYLDQSAPDTARIALHLRAAKQAFGYFTPSPDIARLQGIWRLQMGRYLIRQQRFAAADASLTAAAQVLQQPAYPYWAAICALQQVTLSFRQGNFARTRQTGQRLLPVLIALGDYQACIDLYRMMVTTHRSLGEQGLAWTMEDSLRTWEQLALQQQMARQDRQQAVQAVQMWSLARAPSMAPQPFIDPLFFISTLFLGLLLLAGATWLIWKRQTPRSTPPAAFADPGHMAYMQRVIEQVQGLLSELRKPLAHLLHPPQPQDAAAPAFQQMYEKSTEAAVLLNELETLVKLDTGGLERNPYWVFLPKVLAELQERLVPKAQPNGLTLLGDFERLALLETYLDGHVLDILVEKLCLHAIRYAPPHSTVHLRASFRKGQPGTLIMGLQYQSPGLDTEQVKSFFTEHQTQDPKKGSSLGLVLVQRLVHTMGGHISVQSHADRPGVHVIVEIPLEQYRLKPSSSLSLPTTPVDILIVEDVEDMGQMIREALDGHETLWVPDGAVAWEYLQKGLTPALILSDIVMPNMDGLDLLEKLREDPTLSLTPVIFLTALGLEQGQQYKGFALGIDDYIVKPFSLEFLEQRVQKALKRVENRKAKGGEDGASKGDLLWLRAVDTKVRTSLGKQQFGVDSLADELGISDRHLRRRLQMITGLTPIKYITELRMHTARQMLDNSPGIRIGDVALSVGYQDPEYFSRHFKQRFGVSPTAYLA